ncbi:hypothetical protein ABZX12_37410 [Kribbella sp. NPDC003505]|uniref:hypothetical protein n=1 Tax=Kribbella sp. NPDC003505 TaxID=3154448 RepID=UPI0033BC5DEB
MPRSRRWITRQGLNESDRIEWIPLADVPAMIARHEIVSGITLVGLQQLLLSERG